MVNNIKIIYNLDGIEVGLTADNFWGESTVSRQLGQIEQTIARLKQDLKAIKNIADYGEE